MQLEPDYKITEIKGRLCAVFNKRDFFGGGEPTASFDEKQLLERILNIEGGGRTPTLETKALFDLQRQRQIGRSKLIPPHVSIKK